MMLDCMPSWKTSAGTAQLPKEVVYQQNKHATESVFITTHSDLCLAVFLALLYRNYGNLQKFPLYHFIILYFHTAA